MLVLHRLYTAYINLKSINDSMLTEYFFLCSFEIQISIIGGVIGMQILVIGGTGTISGGIAAEAVKRGYDVTVVNRGTNDSRCPDGAKVVHCDISNAANFTKLLENCIFDVVVDPITYTLIQLQRQLKYLEGHCKTYVFISSVAAIGGGDGVQDENSDKTPEWSYGRNKLECEKYLETAKLPFNYIILRPSITYGDIRIPIPVSCRKNPYTVIDRIVKGKPMVCFNYMGKNESYHPLMDIRDFSAYAVELFDKEYAFNQDYIICAEKFYTWEEAYRDLYMKLQTSPHIYEVDPMVFKKLVPSLYEDILYDKGAKNTVYKKDKIKKETGLNIEEISLSQGISDLVDYLKANYATKPLEDDFNLLQDAILLYEIDNKDDFLDIYLSSLSGDYLAAARKYYKHQLLETRYGNYFIYKVLRKVRRLLRP